MERSVEELSAYRFSKAKEDLDNAKVLFETGIYKLSFK